MQKTVATAANMLEAAFVGMPVNMKYANIGNMPPKVALMSNSDPMADDAYSL